MDTLLSHSRGVVNDSDVTDVGRSHDNDKMTNVVHPDYIHMSRSSRVGNIYCIYMFLYMKNWIVCMSSTHEPRQ